MTDSSSTLNLLTFARHLLRQRSESCIVFEFIRDLRASDVSVYYPASANLANSHEELDLTEPIILHIAGKSNRAVVIGLGYTYFNPKTGETYFEPDDAAMEFEGKSESPFLYGPGVLSVAGPLAITASLIRDFVNSKKEMPGHLIIVLTPKSNEGGKVFTKTLEKVNDLIEDKKLKPIITLIPGGVRHGTSKKKIKIAKKSKKSLNLVAGSVGMISLQFLVKGTPAASSARFSAFDPTALSSFLMSKFLESPILWENKEDFPLVPPVITCWKTDKSFSAGYPPEWASFIISLLYQNNDPSNLVSQIHSLSFETFSKYISLLGKQFNELISHSKAITKKLTIPKWKPQVFSFKELKREYKKELPPLEMSDEPSLEEVQQASLERFKLVAENCSCSDEPFIAYSLVPPVLPAYKLDANILVWPILKKSLKDTGGKLTPWGLLNSVWQRLMFSQWGSRNQRFWQEDAPIGDFVEGFSPIEKHNFGPIIAFGPVGFDEGLKTERLLIDPSFTQLPELLKSMINNVMTLEEYTTFVDKFKKRIRTISSRLGISKEVDDYDDDD
ncbi:MAG: hypothetical protein K8S87_12060 [Planctomycetes bacterium]|nr:hypothetical protein [Planctomycetota bacterium]